MITNKITAIIVDDEEKARNILLQMLTENCPQVNVLAQCKNIPDAVTAITQHRPDVVFLDVYMPVYSGFQLLDFFPEVNFDIVFTTAYSEYALQAFRVSAIDFLLKPIDIDHLCDAVEKVQRKQNRYTYNQQLNLVRNSVQKKPLEKIAVSGIESIEFIQLSEIIYLQADRAYTKLFLTEGREVLASKNIKEFEEMLEADKNFMRVHRSYMVNLKQIKRFVKTEGGIIETTNGQKIPISREQKEEFIQRMTT